MITQDLLKNDVTSNNNVLSMFEISPIDSGSKVKNNKHIQTIISLLNSGNYEQALKYIEHKTFSVTENPIIQELQGAALAKIGNISKAISVFKKIKITHPLQYTVLTKLGDIYLFQGKPDAAQRMFEESAKIAPSFRFNHQRLGTIYEDKGLNLKAVAAYEKGLVGTNQEYLGIKIRLARLLLNMGRSKRVIALLSPFGKDIDGTLGYSGHLILGMGYLNEKYFDRAQVQFNFSAILQPNAIGLLYAYAKMHKANKHYDKALSLYKKAVDKRPKLLSLHLDLADIYFVMDQEKNAMQELNIARDIAQPPWPITELIIQALTKQQRYTEAFDETLSLYQAKPNNIYLERLGSLAQKLTDKQMATATLEKLLLATHEPAEVLYIMGQFYSYHKDYVKSLIVVNNSLKLVPGVTKYLKIKSLILLRLGQKEKALTVVKQMQNNKDSDPENFYMGTVFEINGKYKSAILLYQKALENKPDNIIILNNLAWVEQKSGDVENALITAQKAYNLDQSSTVIMDTYGWVLFLNKQYEEASKILISAIEVDKPDPNTLYRLAKVEEARLHFNSAKNYLLLALSNDVGFEKKSESIDLLSALKSK